MTKKKIGWDSWSEREKDWILSTSKHINKQTDMDLIDSEDDDAEYNDKSYREPNINDFIIPERPKYLYTPFGVYDPDCMLKPSDRWECFLGHTNFPISKLQLHILNNKIKGVAALAILDSYTFCVGIARMYDWSEVRIDIERNLLNEI